MSNRIDEQKKNFADFTHRIPINYIYQNTIHKIKQISSDIRYQSDFMYMLIEVCMEIIYDDIVEYYHDEIDRISKNKEKFYQIFDIPKKNGGKRHIAQPLSELKQLQKILNTAIELNTLAVSN